MNILFVEDNAVDRAVTLRRMAVSAPDVVVSVASTLAEARAHLAGDAPCDLVLTDIGLPDGSGHELIVEIRKRERPIAVVALTGSAEIHVAIAAMRAGADDYVVKRDDYLKRLPDVLRAAVQRFRVQRIERARTLRVLHLAHAPESADALVTYLRAHAPHVQADAALDAGAFVRLLGHAAGERCAYDVLVLDHTREGLEALDLVKRIRDERNLDVPVILVADAGDGEIAAHALRLGADHYVVRYPGHLHTLAALLDSSAAKLQLSRKQAALSRNEAVVRARDEALRAITQGVVLTDTRLAVTYVNAAFERITGYTASEFDGQSCGVLQGPGTDPTVAAALRAAVRSGEGFECEILNYRKDGTPFWNELSVYPVRAEGGRLLQFVGILRDVTARKETEVALRRSEGMLRVAQRQARLGHWQVDLPDGRAWWSEESYEILGVDRSTPAQAVTAAFFRALHPEDRPRVRQQIREALANGVGIDDDFRLVHADGRIAYVASSVKVTRDPQGVVNGIRGIFQDVTAREEAKRELRRRERNIRSIADNASVGIFVVQHGRVVFANPHLASIGRFSRDEIQGIEVSPERAGEGGAIGFMCRLSQFVADSERGDSYETDVEIGDGQVVPCEIRLAGVMWDGQPAGVVFVTDIALRRQAADAFVQAQKMQAVGQLTGGIAHDFNNILAVILSFGGFVRDALPEGDVRRDDLLEVLRAADRAADLTRQLLIFSEQQPSQKGPLDLNHGVHVFLPTLRRSVGENVTVEVVASVRPAIVRMDPIQFDQVLLNLGVNARDAMPDGGRLRVVLSHPTQEGSGLDAGRYVRLVVSDTGRGIDRATLGRIFEPFFTTKGVGRGTGLGLSTCYAIVTDAGGKISVESEPGQGTTFTIDLPVCDEPISDRVDDLADLVVSAGERVLVVEDDAALRKAAVRIFRAAGYEVLQAEDGDEAIRQLDAHGAELALIVTDVVMPGRGGYAVARHAAIQAPQAGVLLTSGYLDGRAVDVDDSGDLPLLWKPYTPSSLLRSARQVMRAAGGAPASVGPPPAAASSPGPASILVVEDDSHVRAAIRRVLASAGHEVTGVDSVLSARAALASDAVFSAVLCDLMLPDGSGAELVRWLRVEQPDLSRRTIVLTGGAIDDAGRDLLADGRTQVMHKPLDPGALLERVAAMAHSQAPAGPEPVFADVAPVVLDPGIADGGDAGALLVVDDDPSLLEGYCRALRAAGFLVVPATTAEAAVSALEQRPFDAIVTDIGLPGADGLSILRAARTRDPDMPVLLITGSPSVETATIAVQSRAIGYLAKPFPSALLVHEVGRAVEAGHVARLQRKLLAAQAGADEFLLDLPATRKSFEAALRGLYMVFQPIVRAYDGSIFGFEALLRCDEPTLHTPQRVLAAAEVLGRVEDVGRVVRRAVAAVLLEHPHRVDAIFVNLHPAELRSDLLCAVTEPLLQSASRVVLEVTERASLSIGPDLTEHVRVLRAAGYRIAIDDLGEGYAGLTCLAQLRPDIAKIDMSLVRGAPTSPLKREILASLIGVCRRAGITVVAEGIETRDEARLLTDLGCDLLQGFLFARPATAFPATLPFSEHEVPRP